MSRSNGSGSRENEGKTPRWDVFSKFFPTKQGAGGAECTEATDRDYATGESKRCRIQSLRPIRRPDKADFAALPGLFLCILAKWEILDLAKVQLEFNSTMLQYRLTHEGRSTQNRPVCSYEQEPAYDATAAPITIAAKTEAAKHVLPLPLTHR